ncbi:MAG: hypothetical protein ACXQS6_02045 [Candidatus Syntropharchaeales archaeon]
MRLEFDCAGIYCIWLWEMLKDSEPLSSVHFYNDRVKEIMKIEENPLYIIPVGRVI